MLLVALFVFSLLYLAPGDPAAIIAGDQASPEAINRIREALGLDRPFVVRFLEWIGRFLSGDLGMSIFSQQPISTLILQRLQPTLSLMAMTMVLSLLIAIPLGILAAWKKGTIIDRGVMLFSVFGFSVPVFVVGFLATYIFSLQLKWLPVQGYSPLSQGFGPFVRSLILPSLTLGCVYMGIIARITRATMIEVLSQDYIRTAKAKGLATFPILFSHGLRNAAVPITTTVGMGVAFLIGGSVVVETVFSIPGLGRLTAEAILKRDYPIIQSMVLLFSVAYVMVNLIVDILYTIFDPRIRY
jgi:peptide/nickel transport system permease protein